MNTETLVEMKEPSGSIFFVDCLLPDGSWRRGTIGWPHEDALIVAAGCKEDHPDWLVEINRVEKKGM